MDVVIAGGGIVGLACAYELAKAGARVTLLEYGKTGMQATNAAAGMLAPALEAAGPGPMLDAALEAWRTYPDTVAGLEAQAGFGLELQLDGILRVAFDDEQLGEVRARLPWQRAAGIVAHELHAADCREIEPRLSERVAGGVLYEGMGAVSNQLVALAYERAAMAHGARIHQRTPVTGFRRRAGRVTAVISGNTEFPCDAVVLAAGARSGQIARKLGVALPVEPVRGQMIALGGMRQPVHHVVWGPDGYLVPRANGLLFAGATVERVGFRRRTTKAGIAAMWSMAVALVPQLRAATVHFDWTGLRPGTPDGLPIIGPVAPYENLVAATGHYRNGILLGPLTGRWIADGLLRGDWRDIPAAFAPSRFSG